MTTHHCDFCGKESKEINQIQEWLEPTGVQEVCWECLDKIEKINRKAKSEFNKACDNAIKNWIIQNKVN